MLIFQTGKFCFLNYIVVANEQYIYNEIKKKNLSCNCRLFENVP